MKEILTEDQRLEIIQKALSGLEVRYIFSMPTLKIDYFLDKICNELQINLIVGTSETAAIESALGYATYSNNIPVVVIDSNFILPSIKSYFTYANSNNLKIIFVFIEPLPMVIAKELESIGLAPERIDFVQNEAPKIVLGPQILYVDQPCVSNLDSNNMQLQNFYHLTDETFSPDKKQQPTRCAITLIESVLDFLLKLRPDSIILPDAGAAHKLVSSKFNNFFEISLNPENYFWMGVSLRSLRGVALAQPERLPIVVIGDGSMLLQGTEIAWLVKTKTPCIILLLINGQLGNRKLENQVGSASKLPFVHWEKFIQSLGAYCLPIYSTLDKDLITRHVEYVKNESKPLVMLFDTTFETEYLYSL